MRLTDPVAEAAGGPLDRRLDPASRAPLAVALSGGGDSLALLHLACAWARAKGRRVLALTVDHGLNPDSPAWTRFAKEAARAAGADWCGLAWEGPKPAAGLPAAARAARHRLIAEAGREAGARVILFGHTADDAAEGELMRAGDAPDLGSVREWSPSPAWPEGRGLFLLRPLLGLRRAALRDWLEARGLDWLEDPANADPRFARSRARHQLSARPGDPEGGEPRRSRDERDEEVAFLAEAVAAAADGCLAVDRAMVAGTNPEAARRVLAAALLCASGGARPPRTEALEGLRLRLLAGGDRAATLAGARLVASDGWLQFGREAGRRGLQILALAPEHPAVWDGRFEVEADDEGLRVGPLAGLAGRCSKADRAALRAVPAAFRPALPVLMDASGEVFLPRPLGAGPGQILALAGERLAAACGLITQEGPVLPAKLEAPHGARPLVILS